MTGEDQTDKVEGLAEGEKTERSPDVGSGSIVRSDVSETTDPQVGVNVLPASDGTKREGTEVVDGQPTEPRPDPAPEPPAVVLPPIYEYGSDIVTAPPELGLPTREAVMEQLITKHRSMVEVFTKEREDLERGGQEPAVEGDDEKGLRDAVNEVVQTLKGERKALRERNRALSKELFELLDKQDRLKDRSVEISMHQAYIDQLEWKIETEDIKIEQERKHLDEIKATMRKLREISDGYTPDEIRQRTQEIQEEIDQNLLRMEEAHRTMLERVEESNEHHGKFIDAQKRLREREARKAWLARRVELHTEMGKFWEGQIENGRKLDSEEAARPVGPIRDRMLALMSERSPERGQEGDRRPGEQVPVSGQSGPAEAQPKAQRGRGPRGRPRIKVGNAEPSEVPDANKDQIAPVAETGDEKVEEAPAQEATVTPVSVSEPAVGNEGPDGGGV